MQQEQKFTTRSLTDRDLHYPARIRERLGIEAPQKIIALGNIDLLSLPKTALFCSTHSPGRTILAAHDQAVCWREERRCVVSGFHSQIEQECLQILLRGSQPIIICPARGLESMRLPASWKDPLESNRLLALSPFASSVRRVTKELATHRNRFVAALADEVAFAHVTPGGSLDLLLSDANRWGLHCKFL
jgi:predicted Rossmann fold nucleotide-binding protein DprA/Smf involved in DNA uptake